MVEGYNMEFIDQSLKDLDLIIEQRRKELAELRSVNEQLEDSSINNSYTENYIRSSFDKNATQEDDEISVDQVENCDNDGAAVYNILTPGSALELRIQQLERDRASYAELLVKLTLEKKEYHLFMLFQQEMIQRKSEIIQNLERNRRFGSSTSTEGTPGSYIRSSTGSQSVRFVSSPNSHFSSYELSSLCPAALPLDSSSSVDTIAVLEIEENVWFWPSKIGNEKYSKLVHVIFLAILQILFMFFLALGLFLWASRISGLLNSNDSDKFAWDWDHFEYFIAHVFGL
jgi:hypothetical protein